MIPFTAHWKILQTTHHALIPAIPQHYDWRSTPYIQDALKLPCSTLTTSGLRPQVKGLADGGFFLDAPTIEGIALWTPRYQQVWMIPLSRSSWHLVLLHLAISILGIHRSESPSLISRVRQFSRFTFVHRPVHAHVGGLTIFSRPQR
jgi:hypothetical protein